MPSPSAGGGAHGLGADRGPSRTRPTGPRAPVKTRTKPPVDLGQRATLSDKIDQSRARMLEDHPGLGGREGREFERPDRPATYDGGPCRRGVAPMWTFGRCSHISDAGDSGLFRLVPAPTDSFATQRLHWMLPIPQCDFFGMFATTTRAASAPRLLVTIGPYRVLRNEHSLSMGRIVFYDLFDVQQHLWDVFSAHFLCAAAKMQQPSLALLLSLRLAVCIAMLLTLACQIRWQRPFANRTRLHGAIGRPMWTRTLLGFAVLVTAAAGPTAQTSPASLQSDWRRPADIELWSSGQATIQEQLLHHGISHCLGRPLFSGGVAPPGVYGAGPPTLPPPPPEPPDQIDEGFHLEEDILDEAETFHISFWLCSPGVEHHSVDIAVSFPQSVERLQETILETVNGIGHTWLTLVVPIEPQIDEDFGSLVMLPQWVESSRHRVVVLDGRGVDQGVFAFYLSTPITRFNVLAQLGCEPQDPLDV